ncbi:unnamed protein product [Lepeophtheirus salmonis]|uniref:(salmon louse) hypothetical protein n=1 Tax=Lepeophtheirus salmonis TaxID=72036 RepID=A0A7R8CCR3_LEPSM|nr:unnamed protein product [Lepeophtheirus salmonis]CAF2768119.1 unnamed protein product [Lepeophtheirus salmonis]
MSEDKTYSDSSEDRANFKGWQKKWSQGGIPLLVAMFIEVLSPAKSLSLIKNIHTQLELLEKRNFEGLPTDKRILNKIKKKTGGQSQKNDNEHFDEDIDDLIGLYQIPLEYAGCSNVGDLLEQWHCALEYTNMYLSPCKVDYKTIWKQLFTSSKNKEGSDVLTLVELLFVLPISKHKAERFFSFMNRVKTDTRSSLGRKTVNSLLQISIEGPDCIEFNPVAAINISSRESVTPRRVNQRQANKYKKRETKERGLTLIDCKSESDIDSNYDE